MIGRQILTAVLLAAPVSTASGQELRGKTFAFVYAEQPGRIFVAKSGNVYYTYVAVGGGVEFRANKSFRATMHGCTYQTFATYSGNTLTLDWTNDCSTGIRASAHVVLSSDGATCSLRLNFRTSIPGDPNSSGGGPADSCSILSGNQL
ncbi:MAG: hypothetical protein HY242_09550 [Afipia sp.]|nr:hypothetical protein [Afipia sp.]